MPGTPQSTATFWSIFALFLRLGLTSFGGPVAHIGYFRHEFVSKQRWLSERDYVDLVALCQFLPGPASSQVGMAIGMIKAGYAAAQAVPGPLFTFAAFLGAVINSGPAGISGAVLALLAIFLPSCSILFAVLPFWQRVRTALAIRSAMAGIGASVVGLLLAALYQPILTGSIFTATDFAVVLLALLALMYRKLPPWLVVAAGAVIGALLHSTGAS